MLLAATIVLACGVDGRSHEADGTEPHLSEPAAEAPATSPSAATSPKPSTPEPTATEAEASEPTPSMPSLEDLLRLPAPVAQADGVAPQLKPGKPDEGESEDEGGDPQRLHLELETRSDPAAVRPSTSRDRTDAGVSLDVSETIRLRGGVRLEEESGTEPDDPVPTVGIEKRF
jgi:hypothetical protein